MAGGTGCKLRALLDDTDFVSTLANTNNSSSIIGGHTNADMGIGSIHSQHIQRQSSYYLNENNNQNQQHLLAGNQQQQQYHNRAEPIPYQGQLGK